MFLGGFSGVSGLTKNFACSRNDGLKCSESFQAARRDAGFLDQNSVDWILY